MSIRFVLVLMAVITIGMSGHSLAGQPIKVNVIAPAFAPLQMNVDGKVKGYVVDLVRRVIDEVSKSHKIVSSGVKILPWRRALSVVEKNPNTLLFSISRTAKRESKFLWVGEVSPYKIYFYKQKKNKQLKTQTLADLRRAGYRVGVQVGSNTQDLLEKMGFENGVNYVTYSHFSKGIKMLFRNRFTMLPLTSFVARANVCKQGFDGDRIEPVIRIDELSNPLWMVFSKGTDRKLVQVFRAALEKLKAAKVDVEIRQVYLRNWHTQNCAKK